MITPFYIHSFPILLFTLLISCARVPSSPNQTYTASVTYQENSFTGTSLSNQTVLILPVLTKNGLDATPSLSPENIAKMLRKVRADVEPVYKNEFEAHYKSRHDSASLAGFYGLLYKSDVVALQNSDSVWKQMKTAYCLAPRIRNALLIRGFDGVVKRRMVFEAELWRVDSAEAVLRIEVQCSARGEKITDADFIRTALAAAFEKLPVFAPANNERDW